MDNTPLRRKPPVPSGSSNQPKIWAEGRQKPPFVPRAFAAASLHYARQGAGTLFGATARGTARLAAKVARGDIRLPADRLGRAGRFVPAHTRVAAWIMGAADILTRSGFIAHSDPTRAATLRASILPLDWAQILPGGGPAAPPETDAAGDPAQIAPAQAERILTAPEQIAPAATGPDQTAPVTLREPAQSVQDDPLAAIRADLSAATPDAAARPAARPRAAPLPVRPPAPRGPLAEGLIDVAGFALGWAASLIALPYGLLRATWAHLKGEDLRKLTRPG